MKGCFRTFCAAVSIIGCAASVQAQAAATQQDHPAVRSSFAAYLVFSNERSGLRERQSVVLSPFGVKLKGKGLFGGRGDGAFITDFERDLSWVVDMEKKIYAELPRDLKDSEGPVEGSSGIMSTAPCMDAEAKVLLPAKESNLRIERYRCEYEGTARKQYYDTEFGVVVKEEHPNGDTYHLMNLRPVNFKGEFYSPPVGYQPVSLQDFYGGLSEYVTP